ncbi:NYN domain-containing protein [bacterium]|nr:NYN domain-containing protein [bacterium]
MSRVLFIDAENIRLSDTDRDILCSLYPVDRILIYGNLEKNNILKHYQHWVMDLEDCWMIHVPSINGKNSVDLQISVDMMEMYFSHGMTDAVLVSHDRDFLPVCSKLRGYGLDVVIVCQRQQNTVFDAFTTVCLNDIDPDLRIVIYCFLFERTASMELVYLNRLLKKINKRKKMRDLTALRTNLETAWRNYFTLVGDKIVRTGAVKKMIRAAGS